MKKILILIYIQQILQIIQYKNKKRVIIKKLKKRKKKRIKKKHKIN